MIKIDKEKLDKITSGFNIPPKPEVLNQIQVITQSEEPNLAELATVISEDLGLSSAILKTINSPFFGMNRAISDIKQAVMFLGLTQVETIATCLLLKKAFYGESCISMDRFWDNATDVANAMLLVGVLIKDKVPLETLYTVGLFHDCGMAAMSLKYSDYKDSLLMANNSVIESLIDIENRIYNTNHATVGYFIASSWHLPKDICTLILQHHEHGFLSQVQNGDEFNYAYAVLKSAENIVEYTKNYRESFDWKFVKEQCFEMLGITETDYKDLEEDYGELYS